MNYWCEKCGGLLGAAVFAFHGNPCRCQPDVTSAVLLTHSLDSMRGRTTAELEWVIKKYRAENAALRADVKRWKEKCHELTAPHYILDPDLRAAKFRAVLAKEAQP